MSDGIFAFALGTWKGCSLQGARTFESPGQRRAGEVKTPGVLLAALVFACCVAAPGVAMAADSYEPNNVYTQAAMPLLPGSTYTSFVWTENDVDWYAFYASGPGHVTVNVAQPADMFLEMRLCDASNAAEPLGWLSRIGNNYDPNYQPGQPMSIAYTVPSAGLYYVSVQCRWDTWYVPTGLGYYVQAPKYCQTHPYYLSVSGDVITTLPGPTSITIRTSATATSIGKTPILSGSVSPSAMRGVNIVVYVKKPGKRFWTYSSNRTAYALRDGTAWQYKYYFKRGMTKGIYYFKGSAPAPGFASSAGFAGSESSVISIRLK
jgi:hypothetical protein